MFYFLEEIIRINHITTNRKFSLKPSVDIAHFTVHNKEKLSHTFNIAFLVEPLNFKPRKP